MSKIVSLTSALTALALLGAGEAAAHATLETTEAPANSTYKAVLRVPQGCEGKPTIAVRVRIPEGVIAAKPMPKPGGQLTTVKDKYQSSYDYFGVQVSEGVVELSSSGGELPDEWYEEFIFRARLTHFEPGTTVYFPVVQECADGLVHRWIEIPAEGKTADDHEEPAPGVKIVERPGGP